MCGLDRCVLRTGTMDVINQLCSIYVWTCRRHAQAFIPVSSSSRPKHYSRAERKKTNYNRGDGTEAMLIFHLPDCY